MDMKEIIDNLSEETKQSLRNDIEQFLLEEQLSPPEDIKIIELEDDW